MSMTPQKVVLTDPDRTWSDDAPEEVELGPFTQGVLIDEDVDWEIPCLRDVASGRVLIYLSTAGHMLVDETGETVRSSKANGADRYRRVFIQTYPTDGS